MDSRNDSDNIWITCLWKKLYKEKIYLAQLLVIIFNKSLTRSSLSFMGITKRDDHLVIDCTNRKIELSLIYFTYLNGIDGKISTFTQKSVQQPIHKSTSSGDVSSELCA